jgi:hypothetical protein
LLLIDAQMVQTEYQQQNLLGSILMFLDLNNRLRHWVYDIQIMFRF